ncbi:MAG: hypothetical protein HY219_00415, partial [Candidatus Staskawiczbacteria bacterium]|nr:hypothetical protein [Candidatus Staskawiczbacteria bacterium]
RLLKNAQEDAARLLKNAQEDAARLLKNAQEDAARLLKNTPENEFRIPKTEKSGRVHTSTITVAVLLKPKKTEININPADLQIDTYKASGPGGQYVNKTESAIRITHRPTGLVVTSQSERNQLQNRENAMSVLAARLLQRQEEQDLSKLSSERREQIGWAKRSEKIRTYNYPQNRITDHRIGKSWHDLENIVNGNLEPIIKTFRKLEQEKK